MAVELRTIQSNDGTQKPDSRGGIELLTSSFLVRVIKFLAAWPRQVGPPRYPLQWRPFVFKLM